MSTTSSDTTTTFEALGCTVFVAVRDPAELAAARGLAVRVVVDVDETCSRFRADSDLSRVNAHPGEWVEVDPLLVAAVDVAIGAARETGGLVHPLLGRQLVALGYDRDFGALVDRDGAEVVETEVSDLDAWQRIGLDPSGGIRIPPGTSLDLGATGKAWVADLVAAAYEEHLRGSAVVSVGGDVRIAQRDPEPWPIAIAERPGSVPDEVVHLDAGGMATSSTCVRRWTLRGARLHHLLDPRTGRPAPEVWRTVTATGATCSSANTATTAAVVLGTAAPGWLESRGVSARLVAADGSVHRVGAWPEGRRAA